MSLYYEMQISYADAATTGTVYVHVLTKLALSLHITNFIGEEKYLESFCDNVES